MTSCGPYKPPAGGCVPHTEVFWARKESDASPVLLYLQVTCVAGRAVKTLTTDKAGTTPAIGYTEADKIGTVIKGERGASCEDPVHVKVCEPVGAIKIEFSETLMHSASTEQTLFRIREFNEDTGLWSLRYENLNGTPYVGVLPADLTVATAQVNVTQTAVPGCANGVAYEQRTTSRFDAETGALESTLTSWYDAAGVEFVAAPAGFALGACAPVTPDRKILVYLERSAGITAMADIVAACGTDRILSVTVKQISGTGSVVGDAGSGVPLSAGETWSWSCVSGLDGLDHLGGSALSMDAGGNEQRITATYLP